MVNNISIWVIEIGQKGNITALLFKERLPDQAESFLSDHK